MFDILPESHVMHIVFNTSLKLSVDSVLGNQST